MDAETIIAHLVTPIQTVRGVSAIVLGGSRATQTHSPQSDIDIGLYYTDASTFDLGTLSQIATELDDTHRINVVTPIGGWGKWVNGGGWLMIDGCPVDLIYRDLGRVTRQIDHALDGNVEIHYHWGHPHGFLSTIYAAEVAACLPLWEADNAISALKLRLQPYPPALKTTMIRTFGDEASFMLFGARHSLPRNDVSYTAGCCFRAIACLMHVLFALNERFMLNEKGAVALAATFPLTPVSLDARVNDIYQALAPEKPALAKALDQLDALIAEIRALG